MSLSIMMQSISQLAMKYGQTTAEAIQGAFNTNICLSSSDPITAKYFSNLSGRVRERQKKSIIADDSLQDYREYNLFNADDVRTMDESEALIISKNRYPIKLNVVPFYQNRKFKIASMFPGSAVIKKNININVPLEDL